MIRNRIKKGKNRHPMKKVAMKNQNIIKKAIVNLLMTLMMIIKKSIKATRIHLVKNQKIKLLSNKIIKANIINQYNQQKTKMYREKFQI